MSGIDRAAVGWSIGIVAVAVGIAFYGLSSPVETPTTPTTPSPAADEDHSPPSASPAADVPLETPQDGGIMTEEVTDTLPGVAQVLMPLGTNLPGCEDDRSCLVPSVARIEAGGAVSWTNQDTSSHTVTSGSPATGPTGIFDSSLIISGETFEYTFEEPGQYEYFCLVHPWVVGAVQVD